MMDEDMTYEDGEFWRENRKEINCEEDQDGNYK
jgi:hypothetical protein